MKRTIALKLRITPEQHAALLLLQQEFARTCNRIVAIAAQSRCWNKPVLHELAYYPIRATTDLGSQMVCQAIGAVCNALKVLKIKKNETVPFVTFRSNTSIAFDKRTYSFQKEALSLYTLSGRILVPMTLGEFQQDLLKQGTPKEAQLLYKHKNWYFNLVLDVPDVPQPSSAKTDSNVLGVDLGENVLAATSSGKIFSGKQLRHRCDKKLAQRRRLQSNGTKSAKQRLKKTSGKEARYIKHVNHQISKALVQEAIDCKCLFIALENLKHIRKRIKGDKRIRIRLHRWPWHQLQQFIQYKAQAQGIKVVLVNPAYTSKLCSDCGAKGMRDKHRFVCENCGIQRHSDLNASLNIRRIAVSADTATGIVNYPNVAASTKSTISPVL